MCLILEEVVGKPTEEYHTDITANKLTTSSISITRDLHCWQMSFSWIPFGHYKSWNFHIGVKAGSLQDLKYEKSQSMYDNLY